MTISNGLQSFSFYDYEKRVKENYYVQPSYNPVLPEVLEPIKYIRITGGPTGYIRMSDFEVYTGLGCTGTKIVPTTATAEGFLQAGNEPSKVLNSAPATIWVSSSNSVHWLMVELPNNSFPKSFRCRSHNSGNVFTDATIETSTDGLVWRNHGSYTMIASSGDWGSWQTKNLNSTFQEIIIETPIHQWPLTTHINDIIGDWHLTNNGSITYSSENGLLCDGSNTKYLSIDNRTFPTNYTMCCWIKTNYDSANTRGIFGSRTVHADYVASFIHNSSFGIEARSFGTTSLTGLAQHLISRNEWVLVAVGEDDNGSFAYVSDGIYLTGAKGNQQSYKSNYNLIIGGTYCGRRFWHTKEILLT